MLELFSPRLPFWWRSVQECMCSWAYGRGGQAFSFYERLRSTLSECSSCCCCSFESSLSDIFHFKSLQKKKKLVNFRQIFDCILLTDEAEIDWTLCLANLCQFLVQDEHEERVVMRNVGKYLIMRCECVYVFACNQKHCWAGPHEFRFRVLL